MLRCDLEHEAWSILARAMRKGGIDFSAEFRRVAASPSVASPPKRQSGQADQNPAYLAPIWQFLPDRERHLGLGSNDCGNPILRCAATSADGARRIRTADLLGAIQALCQLSYSPGLCGGGKLVPLPRKRQDNRIVFGSLLRET